MNAFFSPHIRLAHMYWSQFLVPGDTAVDATCGNGHDTCFLAHLTLAEEKGRLISIDMQAEALEQAKKNAKEQLTPEQFHRIEWVLGSHKTFPDDLQPGEAALFVYNLGYLPGADKTVTTTTSSTLASVQAALGLVKRGGAISITCYPGHDEGLKEEQTLVAMLEGLDARFWEVCHHKWLNRHARAPSLILIKSRNYKSKQKDKESPPLSR